MHHAVERSLIGLRLVLRHHGDAVKEVAVAKQRREDRDGLFRAGQLRDVSECRREALSAGQRYSERRFERALLLGL